jgi:AbrB family looped-hinge helix DNA binding protein
MDITKLSSKGQVVIPKDVRERQRWTAGQAFDVVETEEGVLLRPHGPFPPTRMEDLGTALNYKGPNLPVEVLGIEALPYTDPYEGEGDDGT